MTEHSKNEIFHASSFLQGHNAAYVEQLYARFSNDPDSVDEAWAEFFRQLGDADTQVKAEATGPSWARRSSYAADDLTAALTGEWPAEEAREAGKFEASVGGAVEGFQLELFHEDAFLPVHSASQASFSVEIACSQSSTSLAIAAGFWRSGLESHASLSPMSRSAVP